ncbi:hypothetical protein AADZ91_14815 [Colwelliaceae bacterium 6441]
MINKYQKTLQLYIEKQKEIQLTSFKNKYGDPCSWDDYLWIGQNPDTHKFYNLFFLNPNEVTQPHTSKLYSGKQVLSGLASELAKTYTLDLIIQQGFKKDTLRKQLAAREIIFWLKGEIWKLTQVKLDTWMGNVAAHKTPLIRSFINYCHEQGFLPKTVRFNHINDRDISLERTLLRKKEKMPSEQIILATASIFHTIVPHNNDEIDIFDNVRDRFVSCMSAIALSSPNRMIAEQLILNNQQLKSKQVKLPSKENNKPKKENNDDKVIKENTIHWLDWQGSKGYKDNRNHILASMAPFVERALNYLDIVCEPARILSRYYTNPNAELKNILFNFKPKSLHGLSLNKPVNLFQLGGLLGFYDNAKIESLELDGFPYTADVHRKIYWRAPIANILLGTNTLVNRKYLPFKQDQQKISLIEIEFLWLSLIKKELPAFPYRYIGDSNSKVKLEHALCLFTGAQLQLGGGSRTMFQGSAGSSFFAIDSIDLSSIIKLSLGKNGIFQRNGFNGSFQITPHQFRHYLNTKYQDSELPEIVIAMLSGRVNVESNADYDHTSDSAKVAQIAHINTPDFERNVKTITQEEYEIATGKVAHAMSTGICTQQLHQTPCTHLNDFLTQCVGCRSSCHLNRDVEAIELLEQDLAIQQYRLEEVKNSPNIKTNPIRQSWFKTHHTNVFVLEELIKLMKSHEIKEGSLIRYAGDESAFQLIDIQKRKRIDHKISLPNSQKALEALLMDLKKDNNSSSMQGVDNLLTKLGVSI